MNTPKVYRSGLSLIKNVLLRNKSTSNAVPAKKVVMLFSRGNISLQKGSYATREQLDARWKKIKAVDFSSL